MFQLEPFPDIILGSPGCGKTTALLDIIAEELSRGTLPGEIGLVTFTNAAANEAADRTAKRFNLKREDLPHFRTIHSMAARSTGIGGKNLLEGDKLLAFGEWIGAPLSGRKMSEDGLIGAGYTRGDRMLFCDGLARIKRIPLREVFQAEREPGLEWAVLDRFSRGLKEYKAAHHIHDFTDMLETFVAEGKSPRLRVLLVDEAQDLSLLQWDVVKLLAKGCERVVVCFDDDQAIHTWAGASIETALNLEGTVTVLGQSYRVPRAVQAVALKIIKRVKQRRVKDWSPRDDDGVVRYLPYPADVEFSGDSVMVLARNRQQLWGIADKLTADGVLYMLENTHSVKPALNAAIVCWTRLFRGEPQLAKDIVAGPYALMASGTTVARGHKKLPAFQPDDKVSMSDLLEKGGLLTTAEWYLALDKIPPGEAAYIRKARRQGERLTIPPRVKLSTIHGSKGAEADHVILMAGMATRSYEGMRTNPDSEHRVFYVGASRAKQKLTITDYRKTKAYNFGVA